MEGTTEVGKDGGVARWWRDEKESKERREKKKEEREREREREKAQQQESKQRCRGKSRTRRSLTNGWGVDGPVSLKWSRADPSDQDEVSFGDSS
jgi:hypothetical protein